MVNGPLPHVTMKGSLNKPKAMKVRVGAFCRILPFSFHCLGQDLLQCDI